jgi:hypothetical protein
MLCVFGVTEDGRANRMIREQRYGIRSLKRDFPDDNTVLEFMFDALHSRKCSCGGTYSMVTGRRQFYCSKCRFQIAPTADTIFAKSETPLMLWLQAILLIKDGYSIADIAKQLNLGYKVAWRIATLLNSARSNDTIDLCLIKKSIIKNTESKTPTKSPNTSDVTMKPIKRKKDNTTGNTKPKTESVTVGMPLPVTSGYGLRFLPVTQKTNLNVLVAESKRLNSWVLTI